MWDIVNMEVNGLTILVFLLAGIGTGIVNTLVGSGSLITLPIFVFMCGLPADVANGTNRIGVLVQSTVGFFAFKRQRPEFAKGNPWLALPCVLGAILGAWLATDLDAKTMNNFIGGLMVAMLGVLLINPKRWLKESQTSTLQDRKPLTLFIFFLIGVYAGFIQAGTGVFLIIALVMVAKYTLRETTGFKLLVVVLLSIPALIIFFLSGDVHIGWGLLMAMAQSIGALIAVRFVSKAPNATKWIYRILVFVILASAAKFLGIYDFLLSLFIVQ
ncbi:MAG: sulfite exporter TauE/SafE family protein [Bacteroidota bacterium]